MSVFTTAKSPYWNYDFWRGGHRFHGSFDGQKGRPRIPKERPKKEAERAETLIRAQADRPPEQPRLTLAEASTRYWNETAQHFADKSGEWGRLRNLQRLLGKDTYIDELDDGSVSRFVATRRLEPARFKKTPVSNATVNRELECLWRILKRCRKPWGVAAPELEMGPHKLAEPKERVRALTSDEDKAIFEACRKLRPDFMDMLEFALLTGKRLSEVILLEKRRVDRKNMEARVIEKGGREIAISLTSSTLAIIERNWMHHPTRVFTYVCQQNNTGKKHVHRKGLRYPFTADGWRKPWKAILTEAKVTDFRFHDFRHTAGSRVLQATGNLKAVQETLSHASITSSARYAHLDTAQKRSALEAAEKLRVPTDPQTEKAADGKNDGGSNS